MKKSLRVGAVVLAAIMPAVARVDGQAQADPTKPQLRAGVSVQMPATTSAVAVREADNVDSFVLAVTARGTVYLGVTPVTPADLPEKIKADASIRAGKRVYLKSDARTAYAVVEEVLDAMRSAGVSAPVLLTDQREGSDAGMPLPPKGIEVRVGPSLPADSAAVVVHVSGSGQPSPTLTVAGEQVTAANLQATLRQRLQYLADKVVVVKGDAQTPFGEVVHAIDACRALGAKVFLATPGV